MDRICATLAPGAPRPGDSDPDPDPDEALRRARATAPERTQVWSVRELDHLYTRDGGTVTARQTDPATIELTVTSTLPDGGTVTAYTDWTPGDEAYAVRLPLLQALRTQPPDAAEAATRIRLHGMGVRL